MDSNNVALCPESEAGVKPGVAGGPQDSAPSSAAAPSGTDAATSGNPAATTGSDVPSAQISSSSVQGADTANGAPTGTAVVPNPTASDPAGATFASIDLKNKAASTDTFVAPAASDAPASTATDAAPSGTAPSDTAATVPAPTVLADGAANGSADSAAVPPPVEEG